MTYYKYLVLNLDENLTFDKHVSYLKGKITGKMKTLGRVRQYVSKNLALQLYKTLIIPDFDYGDQVYDAMSASNSAKLQCMQNRCLRICLNSQPRTPVESLHREAGLPKLSTRREAHTCNLVYKGLYDASSDGINHMFVLPEPRENNNTRALDNMTLTVPRNRIGVSDGNVRVRGAKYFNDLSTETRRKPTYNSFKESVKRDKGIGVQQGNV